MGTNEPFMAGDQTFVRIAQLMVEFNEAVGDFGSVQAVGGEICSAAGIGTPEQIIEATIAMGGDSRVVLNRPWKMLAAVAYQAAQNGTPLLAGRILGFMYYWNTSIVPQLDKADLIAVPLGNCPAPIEVEIAAIAFDALRQMPSDQIILSNATGSMDVRILSRAAATILIHAPEKGMQVDEAMLSAARSVLS
jgi:hypothetical protein